MRSCPACGAEYTDVCVSLVVCEDDDDVGFGLGSGRDVGVGEQEEENCEGNDGLYRWEFGFHDDPCWF